MTRYQCSLCKGSGVVYPEGVATWCIACDGSGWLWDHTVVQPVFVYEIHAT